MIPLYFSQGIAYIWNEAGLPLALMTEETKWLIDNGIGKLVSVKDFKCDPQDQANVQKKLEEIEKELFAHSREKRIKEITANLDTIIAGKLKKLASAGRGDAEIDREEILKIEISKIPKACESKKLIQIHRENLWPVELEDVCCDRLIPAVDKIRSEVFNDLKSRDLFVTDGKKFGSHFLVYPGTNFDYFQPRGNGRMYVRDLADLVKHWKES